MRLMGRRVSKDEQALPRQASEQGRLGGGNSAGKGRHLLPPSGLTAVLQWSLDQLPCLCSTPKFTFNTAATATFLKVQSDSDAPLLKVLDGGRLGSRSYVAGRLDLPSPAGPLPKVFARGAPFLRKGSGWGPTASAQASSPGAPTTVMTVLSSQVSA